MVGNGILMNKISYFVVQQVFWEDNDEVEHDKDLNKYKDITREERGTVCVVTWLNKLHTSESVAT